MRYKMVLYVGYPINYATACDLFRIREDATVNDVHRIIEQYDLKLFTTDKGQCILGLSIDEVGDLWDTFVPVDDALILILKAKAAFKQRIKAAGVDISEFDLERMECEPLRVKNPEPFLISC
jgi:hypothetical protein